MPEPADRHPELTGHPELRAAGVHQVWNAAQSAILVRAVPGALLQQHGSQLFPLVATAKRFDREEGLGDQVAVALQPKDLRARREPVPVAQGLGDRDLSLPIPSD